MAKLAALSAFEEQVRAALRHVHDSAWLALHSPLAAPHFLAQLPPSLGAGGDRGVTLQRSLRQAAQTLWSAGIDLTDAHVLAARDGDDIARYHYLILDLNYFHDHISRPLLLRHNHAIPQSVIYNDILHTSRASHDRHLQAAIRHLAAQLLGMLRPGMVDEPPSAPALLFGRADEMQQCLDGLRSGRTVNIVGASGTGKTALLAGVASQWPDGPVLVTSCRPHINTYLHSVVAALAHFLRGQGASGLLGQLLADGGDVRDPQLALGLARGDLASLARTPLLCIDDADVLLMRDVEAEAQPARAFLDALRVNVPMLLAGQRAVVTADIDVLVRNLPLPDARDMLSALDMRVEHDALARIHAATGGNARLLTLLAQMRQPGESAQALLERLPDAPRLAAWVERALARMPAEHTALLRAVAIFNRPAPLDAFGAQQLLLLQLAAQGWLVDHGRHSVGMASALCEPVLAGLTQVERAALHVFAAQAHAERGNATAAADHFVRAGQYERALLAWLPHMDAEIRRGHSAQAVDALSRIPAARLSARFAEALASALARLHRGRGAARETVAAAAPLERRLAPTLSLVDGLQHAGWGHEQSGNLDQAMAAYLRGQHTLDKLLAKSVSLAASRASLAVRRRDMPAAQHEASRARFEAERLQGIVFDEAGELNSARTHFLNALALAEALDDASAIAFTCNSLGIVAGRQSDGAAAGQWLARARQGFEALGNQLQAETVRSNEAALLTTLGDYAGAVDVGAHALAFFHQIQHSRLIAATAASMADACVNLGRHEEAVRYAELVLAQEEAQFIPYALYSLAEVDAVRNRHAQASELLANGLRVAQRNNDVFIEAYLRRLFGRVSQALGDHSAAREQRRQARDLFERMGMQAEARATAADA